MVISISTSSPNFRVLNHPGFHSPPARPYRSIRFSWQRYTKAPGGSPWTADPRPPWVVRDFVRFVDG